MIPPPATRSCSRAKPPPSPSRATTIAPSISEYKSYPPNPGSSHTGDGITSEDPYRDEVCSILEEAISPAITTTDDYSVRDKLKAIPSLGTWGFQVKAFEYCCAQFDGGDGQPFYVNKRLETRNALALYAFLKNSKPNSDSFGRVYVFKSRLTSNPIYLPGEEPLYEKFPLGLILLCHELGIQIHDMTWFTEGSRFDEFALPSASRLRANAVRAETDFTDRDRLKRPVMFDFEGCPQVQLLDGKHGLEMQENDPNSTGIRTKSRVYFLSSSDRGILGSGSKWTIIIFIQAVSVLNLQYEHHSVLKFRTVPDYLTSIIQKKSPEEICAAFDDKYQVLKHFHRALIGGDLRVLAVISALLDNIFHRLGSGKSYPARRVRQQDLYATLSRLRACKKILEKRLADIKSIPNPPKRISGKHEDWRAIAAADVEFAIAKTVEMEQMAQSTITLLYNIVTIHESQSVLWLTKMAFLFLPMTFVATIFGMNVKELINSPPTVGVYLTVAITVMVATLLLTAGPVRVMKEAREWFWEFWESAPILVFEREPRYRIYIERPVL